MNNPNLNQAREWAKELEESNFTPSERLSAAMQVIQSLPDHWIDAEEVRELVVKYEAFAEDAEPEGEKGRIRAALYRNFVGVLEALLPAPPLPTLADMTQEEREACKGAQAQTWHEVGIIVWVDEMTEIAQLITRANGVLERKFKDVTPLPDLPKLEWPGGGCYEEIADEPETTESDPIHTPMQPNEVPPNEPWLIEVEGWKAIGTRYPNYTGSPWAVAALNGLLASNYEDSEVTLIHKLVPEPAALPEGMRLADHEGYGRVMVSPRTDDDGDYKVFLRTSEEVTGADWGYAPGSELTFLDGESN